MNTTLAHHQKDLENVFTWIEFIYEQGNSLMEAAKRRLADNIMVKPLPSGTCYTSSRSVSYRYVWLDVDWYISESDSPTERAMFLALSYSSDERVGCYFVLGICDLDPEGSGLIEKPSQIGHWLVDYAVSPSSNLNKLSTIERPDGLLELLPNDTLQPEFRKGLRRIVLAPFPVAWIDKEEKLVSIIHAFVSCFRDDKDEKLGRLCQEATEAVR